MTGAVPPAAALAGRRIADVAALDRAAPWDLSFLDDERFAAAAAATRAGACFTTAALAGHLPARVAALVVDEPYRAFVVAARALFAECPAAVLALPGRRQRRRPGAPERAAGSRRHHRAWRGGRAGGRDRFRHGGRGQCRDRRRGAHRPQLRHRRRRHHRPCLDRRPGRASKPAATSARTALASWRTIRAASRFPGAGA